MGRWLPVGAAVAAKNGRSAPLDAIPTVGSVSAALPARRRPRAMLPKAEKLPSERAAGRCSAQDSETRFAIDRGMHRAGAKWAPARVSRRSRKVSAFWIGPESRVPLGFFQPRESGSGVLDVRSGWRAPASPRGRSRVAMAARARRCHRSLPARCLSGAKAPDTLTAPPESLPGWPTQDVRRRREAHARGRTNSSTF